MDRYALIGFPLGHSLSPQIHNAAFDFLGIEARYELLEIEPARFDKAISTMKKGHWAGFNVTVPFKERVLKHIDFLQDEAAKIAAVNTIKVDKNGNWSGYNTDYRAFARPLLDRAGKIGSCLLIGAGGAARAVALAVVQELNVAELCIVNRTPERASALAGWLMKSSSAEISVLPWNDLPDSRLIFDLLINTTSVGMGETSDRSVVDPLAHAHSATVVYDLIYNPAQTRLLQLAEAGGLQTINGSTMLLEQAAGAFNIWTGKSFPTPVLENLRNTLFNR